MIYKSRNGCLFYYDRVLYKWCIADSTMLFLLGFESVTTYDNSVSDSLTISDRIYTKSTNEIVPFEKFDIYDNIHEYLSEFSCITDENEYLISDINGLKLFMNDLTGTGTDRTIPIIFKNDVNNKSIDLNESMYRFNSSDRSLFNLQAQKIHDIFADANFKETSKDLVSSEDDRIQERVNNSDIFKLLDYKSMYSYALGVLYGCRCIGCDSSLMWHVRPSVWYNGTYKNLVNSAWYTFKFHHLANILDDEDDEYKYRSIMPNRLWNFEEIADEIDYKDPTIELLRLSISHGSSLVEFYHSDEEDEVYTYEKESDGTYSWKWKDLGLQESDDGLSDVNTPIIIKYIANNTINILTGYEANSQEYHPSSKKYFIPAGNIGWVDIDFDHIREDLQDDKYEFDTILMKDTLAVDKLTFDLKHFYRVELNSSSNSDAFYLVDYDESKNLFNEVLSKEEFEAKYKQTYEDITTADKRTVYDLDKPVTIYMSGDYVFDFDLDGDVTLQQYLNNNGYSMQPSKQITLYSQDGTSVISTDFRVYSTDDATYFWNGSADQPEWQANLTNLYEKSASSSNLYRGSYIEVEDAQFYSKYDEADDKSYVFNDESSVYILSAIPSGFVSLDDLYSSLGITVYPCEVILEDTHGNSLLDQNGLPRVWKDTTADTENPYWNGFTNMWQNTSPELDAVMMYDAELKISKSVYDNYADKVISIDDSIVTYDEFYNGVEPIEPDPEEPPTEPEDPPVDPEDPTYTAYSRSGSYQNANQTLNTISYATLYEPDLTNAVSGDTHKDYIITGMWNAAGAEISIDKIGLSCYLYSGNPRIRIKNNSSGDVAWNHIEYKAYDVFRLYLREEHDDYTLKNYSQMNNCFNRNNLNTLTRTADEVYTIIGAYKADGTPVNHTPLRVSYNSAFNGRLNVYNDGTDGPLTFAYVDFTVSGGDKPSTAVSLDDED